MQDILSSIPFNISLLILSPDNLKGLGRISVLDIFEPSSRNFHPAGLFSVDIFGKVGDDRRNKRFGYISLGIDIFHPVIYKELVNLKELYAGIMSGTAYATYDKTLRDFVPSKIGEGSTGYAFFMSHFQDLVFEQRESTSRSEKIRLINQYRKNAIIQNLVVMPAGLRDFTVSPSGKSEEDEINTLYRQVLSIANVINDAKANSDLSYLDSTRFRLQQAVQNIYTYIIGLLEGDSKLIQSWWTTRNIATSSRNVITSNVVKSKKLFDELTIGPNDTAVGLYQYIMSTLPLTINLVRGITQNVFTGINSPAKLVNRKTLKAELISVNPAYYDAWVTQEGLEKTIGYFEAEDRRSQPVLIDDHYFMLVYRDKKHVKLLQDIDDLPEHLDRANVTPLTYAELYYIAVAERARTVYAFVTRYPIINLGGVYPSSVYLKTTTRSVSVKLLGDDWKETNTVLNEYPLPGVAFVNSMSPIYSRLLALGADFDGDMMSFIAAMTDDSYEEITALLKKASYYVSVHGDMNYSSSDDISDLVFAELSE